jgi:acyl carrier protein
MSNFKAKEIENWLVCELAGYVKVNKDEIKVSEPFSRYIMDSSAAVSLTEKLGTWLGVELEPTLFWEYPTIAQVARYLESLESNLEDFAF